MITHMMLRQLLDRAELGLRVVVSTAGLDREIRWVHPTELPDPGRYLGQSELVLTNGLWCTDLASAEVFLARLVDAGAAGLVFGLTEQTPAAPAHLVTACERLGVPLLTLPIEIPFTSVTQAVATAKAELRQRALLDVVTRGNALAAAVAAGAGLDGVLTVLARGRRVPVALVDRQGQRLSAVFGGLSESDARAGAAVLDEVGTGRPVTLESGPATVFAVPDVGPPEFAVVYGSAETDIDEAERAAIEQTLLFVSVEVARRRAARAIELRFAGEIIDMALSGHRRAEELRGRLRSFGVDADGPLAVFAMTVHDVESVVDTAVPTVATDFFTREGRPAVVPAGSSDAIAIVGLSAASDPVTDPPALAHRLAEALAGRLAGRRVAVGVGRVVDGPTALRRGLLEAREALRTAGMRRGPVAVATFAEAGSHRLLLALLDADTRRDFADAVLGRVREHDRHHRSDLMRSLAAYLDNGASWSRAAAHLHVHVNTLRNRLTKLEELAGRDLQCSGDLVDLHLALQIEHDAR
ncbi:PucR family transcriptional regulator [Solihabitans fulvus]|uniref:PucR family transcriptional regulator n=1 Tax=Solihabitans fulvus TaxID=1892852 RepID=A0A5B2WTG6_9PSEU|nr:PucR family transcriptional regulator ligand-binding domain-containing protein [Solihabitans fulvus]KAA2254278.1 PucR family transcriptional regulator [Solihabitans fulvus]